MYRFWLVGCLLLTIGKYTLATKATTTMHQLAIDTVLTQKIKSSTAAITSKDSYQLKPQVMQLALKAFYAAKNKGLAVKKSLITVIDYTIPSTKTRLWVVDVMNHKILYTSLVAHGKYSGDLYTTNFSNQNGSLQTSLGVFLTENTYFGRDGYSLRLQGLEDGFNEKAKIRTIVLHGAPYVSKKYAATYGKLGRSWGCPAVEKPLAKPIINAIKDGSLVFSFYQDRKWLQQSKFINHRFTTVSQQV